MKILLSIALGTILVSVSVQNSMISVTDGIINCDGLTCPEGSSTCTVSKRSFWDSSSYKYIRICADGRGASTDFRAEELENPSPGTVSNIFSQYRSKMRKMTAVERKDFDERINMIVEETDNMEKNAADNLKDTIDYWNNWSSDLNANTENMLPSGFPHTK